MTPEDHNLVDTVTSDLQFLRANWRPHADDHVLRRSSNVLRMLVVDQLYGQAWRAAGLEREPQVEVVDLSLLMSSLQPEWVAFAMAGGGSYNGMTFGTAFSFTDEIGLQAYTEFMQPYIHSRPTTIMPLSRFRESLCMIVYGVRVTRRHIIQYVANKRGGAHFDPTRNKSGDLVFHALDHITDTPTNAPIQLGAPPKPLVYHELLAIGRCLAQTPDTQRFLERAQQVLS
jgi:hypothetical protein